MFTYQILFCIFLSLQMHHWFHVEGERHLLEAESVEDSGDRMEQILNSFTGFLIEANVRLCVCLCLYYWRLPVCSECLSSPSPGPKAPRHVLSVRGRAAAAERLLLPRDGDIQDFCLHLQVGPGGVPVQGRGLRQRAADHGQRV